MAIVKYKNQSGIEYAYESTSYYDPVNKQSRPIRKYLGRVDPETGEIINTKGKRGRPKKNPETKEEKIQTNSVESSKITRLTDRISILEKEIQDLTQENNILKRENRHLHNIINTVYNILENENQKTDTSC